MFKHGDNGPKVCARTGPVRTPLSLTEHDAHQRTELTLWAKAPDTSTQLLPSPLPQRQELVREKASKSLPFPPPSFSLSAFSSKFRTAVFGWCCLGYMPEPQLRRSLGNQASAIFHFCNGRAHAPPRLMRWEIPKYREEFQMLWNKKMTNTIAYSSYFPESWKNWSVELSQGTEGRKAKKWRDRQNPDDIIEASESRCAWVFFLKPWPIYLSW